ncbi:hypothetical protein Tco_0796380 [Tanacetum coccineum]
MLELRDKVKPYIMYNIGNGNIISMWHDRWCEKGPLTDIITNRVIYDAIFKNNAKVAKMIMDGRWILSNEWRDRTVWKEMSSLMKLDKDFKKLEDVANWLADQVFKNNIWKVMNRIILAAVVYYRWQERNYRLFRQECRKQTRDSALYLGVLLVWLYSLWKCSQEDMVGALKVNHMITLEQCLEAADCLVSVLLLALSEIVLSDMFSFSISVWFTKVRPI